MSDLTGCERMQKIFEILGKYCDDKRVISAQRDVLYITVISDKVSDEDMEKLEELRCHKGEDGLFKVFT